MTEVINFKEVDITKEYILSKITDQEIFEYYLQRSIRLGYKISSPLRDDDQNPSFNIFRHYNGELRYKDFGHTAGGCFEFVMNLKRCTYKEALLVIARDFNLTNGLEINIPERKPQPLVQQPDNFKKLIIPVKRGWKKLDYDYWTSKYYIGLDMLVKENIYPCQYVHLQSSKDDIFLWGEHRNNDPIYCYDCFGPGIHKIYRPLTTNKKSKWLGTCSINDIQGLRSLPERGELLIITSSMKDKLVMNVLGYHAIAPGGEAMPISEKIMDYLWACFDNIVLFYDNDIAGKEGADKMMNLNPGLGSIMIPEEFPQKDISDFIDHHRYEETKRLLNKIL